MKNVIGFAGQFYTLWDYETETTYVTDAYGQHWPSQSYTKYFYVKNISTDLDKVQKLYPDLSIDEGLKGRYSSWEKRDPIEKPDGYFWFGKYCGKLIDEILVSDIGYCLWCVANNENKRESLYIQAAPLYIAAKAQIEAENRVRIEESGIVPVGLVELEFTTNGRNYHPDFGCTAYAIYGDTEVIVAFPNAKQVLGRYPYIMPEVNGKLKKTKGKKFTVNVVSVTEPKIEWSYGKERVRQHICVDIVVWDLEKFYERD